MDFLCGNAALVTRQQKPRSFPDSRTKIDDRQRVNTAFKVLCRQYKALIQLILVLCDPNTNSGCEVNTLVDHRQWNTFVRSQNSHSFSQNSLS